MPTEKNSDLLKLILNLIIIGLFIIITYRVVEPFLFGFFWAMMVVITTWPLMEWFQERLFNKRILAVLCMTLILSLVFIIPCILIIVSIAKNSSYLVEFAKDMSQKNLPTLNWIADLPLVGDELHDKWQNLINNDGADLIKQIQPYLGDVVSWIILQLNNIGVFIFHCAVMIVFSALLFLQGESVKKHLYHFAHRISKQYGENTITLAGASIRAVALGVVVTALTLTLLGGASLFIVNMPFVGLITLMLFICCVFQIGPVLIMVLCSAWQFWNGNIFYGIILIIMTIVLTVLDSVMRTFLIKRGVNLPFLLILFGVIGGVLGFGVMGLFIGPVILALSYNITQTWVEEQD